MMTTAYAKPTRTYSTDSNLPEREDTNAFGLASLFWRRKWLLLSCTAVATGLSFLAGTQVKPKYTASALVMFDPREAKVLDVAAVVERMASDVPSIETQLEILNSRMLAENVINKLALSDDPELNAENEAGQESQWAARGLSVLNHALGSLGLSTASLAQERDQGGRAELPSSETSEAALASDEARSRQTPAERTLEAFHDRLRVGQQGDSYVIKVSFTSRDPMKAAHVANGVAEQFVAYQLEAKRAVTRNASEWLGRRLADLRQELESSERAGQAFRAEHGLIVANGIDVPDQELAEVAQAAVVARANTAERVARVEMIERMRSGQGPLDAIPEVINSPLILSLRNQETELLRQEAELKATFGARHPRIQLVGREKTMVAEKMHREIDRILENLRVEAQAAAVRQASLERDVERIKATITQKRQAEVRLGEFQRESDAAKQIYQHVLQRYKETREQQDIVEPDVKVLSAAMPPQRPATPGPLLFGTIGFTSSLLLTSLVLLLRELADTTFRAAGEVERHLGVARIGLVPALRGCTRRRRPHHWLLTRPRSAYAASLHLLLRSLRTTSTASPKLLLLTSSLPEEGKTTLSVSLAAAAAQTGKRVLLVDGDFRHPSIQRELHVGVPAGVIEYGLGEVDLNHAIVHDAETKVDVLPMGGRRLPNPVAVIEDQAFMDRLLALKTYYDLVIVDSAPVLGNPETQTLSTLADQVVFVIRWGSTTRNTAKHALRDLVVAGAPIASVVLTRVNIKRQAQYGYGDAALSYSKYSRYYAN